MKKIILMFSAMFLFAFAALAQTPQTTTDPAEQKQNGRDKMRAHNGKKAANNLGLNAEQKQKMKELNAQHQGKLKALKSDASLTKEQKREKARAIMSEHDNATKSILTAEQSVKWAEMKEQRKARGGKMKGHGKGDHKKEQPKKSDH